MKTFRFVFSAGSFDCGSGYFSKSPSAGEEVFMLQADPRNYQNPRRALS